MGQFLNSNQRRHRPSELYNKHSHLSALDIDSALDMDINLGSNDEKWLRLTRHIYNHYFSEGVSQKNRNIDSSLSALSTLLLNLKKTNSLELEHLKIKLEEVSTSTSTSKSDDVETHLNKLHEVIRQAGQIGLITVFYRQEGSVLILPSETLLSFL